MRRETEERQKTHKRTTFTLLLLSSWLEHPIPRFHPLFSPVQALVSALHTQKQVSVSYGNTGHTWSAPPLTLFIPSSSSLCTRYLCLRLPLAHRTHPPTQKLTHCFITNPLAAHRHLSPSTPTSNHHLPRVDFFTKLVFPPKSVFLPLFLRFLILTPFHRLKKNRIRTNMSKLYLIRNETFFHRTLFCYRSFFVLFLDSCLFFHTYHYLPHTYLWTNYKLCTCFLALRRKMAQKHKNYLNHRFGSPPINSEWEWSQDSQLSVSAPALRDWCWYYNKYQH